jgi:hypothetical protein
MQFKALKTYFVKDQHYVCRFCAAPLGEWQHGRLTHDLTAYRRHKAHLANGGLFVFSSCQTCAAEVDVVAAQKALKACREAGPANKQKVVSVEPYPLPSEELK